jgi:SAM-dependent methyltransferase
MHPNLDPQAIATVLQMATAPWIGQAIYCAAKLNLADHLATGSRSTEDLARATGTHAPSLSRLLRALAGVGLFASDPAGWRATALGAALRADVPGGPRGYAIMLGSPFHRAAWTDMLESVRTGASAFERVHGVPAFEHFARTPDDAAIFDEAMTSISGSEIPALLEAYDFSGFTHVVDVAGGRGHVLAAILERNPRLTGTLFDLPYAIAGARKALAGSSVMDRITFVGGDFFGAIPPGGDAYVLKHIVHDWDDPESLRILANIRKVVPPHGRLLVAECVVPPGDGPSLAKLLDLEMLVLTAQGRERTDDEYRALFARAGFELTRVVPTAGEIAMVEGRPA